MQTDAMSSVAGQTQAGSVVALWRYPVKSMMGEELNSSEVTDRGLLGDRQFAVVDSATGKVGGAKNPRKWGNFFDFRASYAEAPKLGGRISPVRITLRWWATIKLTWSRFSRARSVGILPSWRREPRG